MFSQFTELSDVFPYSGVVQQALFTKTNVFFCFIFYFDQKHKKTKSFLKRDNQEEAKRQFAE